VNEHELRRAFERELHDGPQQQLVALTVGLQLARQLAETDPAALPAHLDELRQNVQVALDDLRRIAARVYPAMLLDAGLVEALRAVAPVEANVSIARYPEDVEADIYFRCVDAVKHAVGPVSIYLWDDDHSPHFELRPQAAPR
jgi:signal transduction histidine kinase